MQFEFGELLLKTASGGMICRQCTFLTKNLISKKIAIRPLLCALAFSPFLLPSHLVYPVLMPADVKMPALPTLTGSYPLGPTDLCNGGTMSTTTMLRRVLTTLKLCEQSMRTCMEPIGKRFSTTMMRPCLSISPRLKHDTPCCT